MAVSTHPGTCAYPAGNAICQKVTDFPSNLSSKLRTAAGDGADKNTDVHPSIRDTGPRVSVGGEAPELDDSSGGVPMKIGAPFNRCKVFQGVFAPYWVLEHRGITTGAKLCYIRLLGFAVTAVRVARFQFPDTATARLAGPKGITIEMWICEPAGTTVDFTIDHFPDAVL
jgi:hypothetical protein